ncbi:MAG: MarR family transcriptional regulator [Bacillota bacterium]|nr:MarR family transcriptional regulator [Bacillota bacterium]
MPDDALRLDRQPCFPLYVAARMIMRLYVPLLEPLGLTYTQYITLLVLWEKDDIPVKAIGDKLYLDTGTLSPVLKILEKQSLIRRRRNPDDERSVLVHLTAQGRLLKHQAAHIPQAVEAAIRLTDEESKTVRRLLDRFQADAL